MVIEWFWALENCRSTESTYALATSRTTQVSSDEARVCVVSHIRFCNQSCLVLGGAKIGTVGRSIDRVNKDISQTAGVRRGVVYSAGVLVFVMSLVYVLVGCYALAKDDGNGKGGGARMRG